jgi:Na+-driven multidrug efflux pump
MGTLKALAAASVINGIGDIILCSFLGYGIAGAAWATMASQVSCANTIQIIILSLHYI